MRACSTSPVDACDRPRRHGAARSRGLRGRCARGRARAAGGASPRLPASSGCARWRRCSRRLPARARDRAQPALQRLARVRSGAACAPARGAAASSLRRSRSPDDEALHLPRAVAAAGAVRLPRARDAARRAGAPRPHARRRGASGRHRARVRGRGPRQRADCARHGSAARSTTPPPIAAVLAPAAAAVGRARRARDTVAPRPRSP